MGSERRQDVRMALSLPVRIVGHDARGGSWEEMATLGDVSAGGASFNLRHAVRKGNIVHLTLPLPKRFRRHDLSEPSYRVYALVRRAASIETGWRVGVLFLGKHAPRDFASDPGGIYLLPTDPRPVRRQAPAEEPRPAGAEDHVTDRRRFGRLQIVVNVMLRRTDHDRPGPQEEQTFAENVSRRGMRVLTSLAVDRDDVLELEELEGDFRTRAAVRGVWIGPDRVPRLNLEFLDGDAPDRMVGVG